ncbi:hypothetical protein D9M69_502180 [compost metagenome]
MKPTPIRDAIGVLKLTGMHLNNPTAIDATLVRDAAEECIERLEQIPAESLALADLYRALLAITPRGWLPHVTLTNLPSHPLGAVVTDEAGNIAARAVGKTVEGLALNIRHRLPAGCGEVSV